MQHYCTLHHQIQLNFSLLVYINKLWSYQYAIANTSIFIKCIFTSWKGPGLLRCSLNCRNKCISSGGRHRPFGPSQSPYCMTCSNKQTAIMKAIDTHKKMTVLYKATKMRRKWNKINTNGLFVKHGKLLIWHFNSLFIKWASFMKHKQNKCLCKPFIRLDWN